MRFQVSAAGWPVGQVLIEPSTIINLDKEDYELTPFERLAKGRGLPIDATALDADAAVALWRAYPWHRERLHRRLDAFNEATFQRLLGMDEATLERLWPRKG